MLPPLPPPHLFPNLPKSILQARIVTQVHRTRRGGVQRVCQVQKMVQVFRCSLFSMEIPQPQTSLVSVLFTNVLLGTGADHSRRGWVNQGNIHSLAAVLGADDLCHSFWSGLTQQLPWKSMWVGRSSLKALRTENVHGVVQSRPFLK